MCFTRLQKGHIPACVEACPQQALSFGAREDLLHRAHQRLRDNPARYLHHVWGEREFGGTSVLYISDVDLSVLDWPARPVESIPSLTEPLVHSTPFIGLTVAASLLGVNWVIKRRMRLAHEQQDAPGASPRSSKGDSAT
jgi:hypothetical protein